MRGRWAALATEASHGRSRSSVAGHASRAQRNRGCWVLGHSGANCPTNIRLYQTCHRRLQQWVREAKLEGILHDLAEELHARGKLKLQEAFIDASFTGQKKGVSRSGPPSAAKGRKSSLSPMITVFLSPLVSKALRRMRANSSKASSGTVSSIHSRRGSSATKPRTVTAWTATWPSAVVGTRAARDESGKFEFTDGPQGTLSDRGLA
jgi:hypothetical protein